MKKLLLSAIIITASSSFTYISFTEVINAIKSGNAAEVAKYFDNTVEITLPGKSSSFSKRQAELVLRDFFSQNPIKNFQVIHQSEKAGSQYCIGNLTTATGVFRTTIYIKQSGNKELIQELRFEK
jgi:antitoxin component YwqK of YwqJK toxin-antitoxin module